MSVVHLKRDIETLELGLDGPQLCQAIQCLDLLTAKITNAVADFDASGGYGIDNAPNMVSWLNRRAAMGPKMARAMCRQGVLLRYLPATCQAWLTGGLSHSQIQAIVANLTNDTVKLFVHDEAVVVPLLVGATVRETAQFMTKWVATADAVIDGPEPPEPAQNVCVNQTFNGRWHITGTLNTAAGALFEKALLLARPADPTLARGAANAAALNEILNFYLTHQTTALGGRHRPHVNVTIDLAQLEGRGQGQLLDSTPLNPQTMRRILCDCNIHRDHQRRLQHRRLWAVDPHHLARPVHGPRPTRPTLPLPRLRTRT